MLRLTSIEGDVGVFVPEGRRCFISVLDASLIKNANNNNNNNMSLSLGNDKIGLILVAYLNEYLSFFISDE